VCEAEVAVLAPEIGAFEPRCCNEPMEPVERPLQFYVCPVCKAEIGVLKEGTGEFRPRCCNKPMELQAA
jgi:hypothetical protein